MRKIYVPIYLLALPICAALAAVLIVVAFSSRASKELIPFCWLPLVPVLIAGPTLVYKSWAVIQDGQARTSPGLAALLLFVPFFNLYWVFQAWYGFAVDYNRYLDRHSSRLPRLSERMYLAYAVATILGNVPFVNFVFGPIWLILLGYVVLENGRAINQLVDGPMQATASSTASTPGHAASPLLIISVILSFVALALFGLGAIGIYDRYSSLDVYQASYDRWVQEEAVLRRAGDAKSLGEADRLRAIMQGNQQRQSDSRRGLWTWVVVVILGLGCAGASVLLFARRRRGLAYHPEQQSFHGARAYRV